MYQRRKRRRFAAEPQSAVTFAAVVSLFRGIGRRRNDRASGERATTPTPRSSRAARARAIYSIDRRSVVHGRRGRHRSFTIVTRRSHQLTEPRAPPSHRIMTLYAGRHCRNLLPRVTAPASYCWPAGKIIYERRGSVGQSRSGPKCGNMQIV